MFSNNFNDWMIIEFVMVEYCCFMIFVMVGNIDWYFLKVDCYWVMIKIIRLVCILGDVFALLSLILLFLVMKEVEIFLLMVEVLIFLLVCKWFIMLIKFVVLFVLIVFITLFIFAIFILPSWEYSIYNILLLIFYLW